MSEFPLPDSIVSELVRRVTEAQELMLKHEIEANTVILNSDKYGVLMKDRYIPTICGLKAEVAALMDNCDFIVQYRAPEPQTNADKIRAMTDGELAQFLYDCTDHPRLEWWQEWVKQSDWEWSE